jgi:uncharacterized protein (TIGR02271 family)
MGQYTIVTMFRERGVVDAVMAELRNAGVVMNDQRILDSGDGSVEAELLRRKVDDDHVRLYVRGVEKGYPLLVGTVDEANLQRATDILDRHGPVDMVNDADLTTDDTVAGDTGTSGAGITAAAAGLRDVNAAGTSGIGTDAGIGVNRDMAAGREEVIPIIEEQIAVGKRAVERGGVRVRSYVVETPVEETIRLRDETVHVERRNVTPGRPAVEADFQERTLEVIETDEEAVVAKRARVTEEVIVRKDVAEHEKTITDTVRRTEVDVVNTGTEVASDRMTGTERIERTRTDT